MTELAIRARRSAFNRAIAEGDLAAISEILSRDCVMVTGSDSAVITGRAAQVRVWKREFASIHRAIYRRLPETVTLSAVEPVAMELGRWEGVDAAGTVVASGTYAAKWREISKSWLLEAEVFVTLG